MTAVEPTTEALELELYEFSMGHTNTLSRDALIAVLRQARDFGLQNSGGDIERAVFIAWGHLLGAVNLVEAIGSGR